MENEIFVFDSLSGGEILREDGAFIRVGGRNPETQIAWQSEEQIKQFLERLARQGNIWTMPVEPKPTPLNYVRYIALVKQAGGLDASAAMQIVDGSHSSGEVNFIQRLMERHKGDFVLTDALVQQGLDTLVSEAVLTTEGRAAIVAAWPVA
jgi:hypothetical protein